MATQLYTRKSIEILSSTLNENGASSISSFAKKQMERMGWKEGQGLGKNEDGISSHIKVSKILDKEGIGIKAVKLQETIATESDWWHDTFHQNAKKFKIKKDKSANPDKSDKKKSRKEKKEKNGEKKERKSKNVTDSLIVPSYDDLFQATGGARLGMRARMNQVGKLKRTEENNVHNKRLKTDEE